MLESLIPLISCVLIAFSIGSNDTSNAFGISVGAGIITFRKAIYLLGVLVFIGAVLQGRNVMRTVGKELVVLNLEILCVSLLVSAFVIILANWKRLPVSSHQAIIGSLVGSGFAFGSVVRFDTLLKIVESWVISPIGSLFLAIIVYRVMEEIFHRLPVFKVERILRMLLILNGILIAYNTGANELATALGPIVCYGILTPLQAAMIGTVMLWLGAFMLSERVVETVGKGITSLDAFSGFSAQFSAGISVLIFTTLGMPVSTTYCIIGGIIGVGMLKGVGTIRFHLLRKIMLSWVVTPLLTFGICCLVAKVISPYI